MRYPRNRVSVRIEVLVGVGVALYIVGILGYLAFGSAFFAAAAFLIFCSVAGTRAATVARKRRLSRERRHRRRRRIEAHDAYWLEDRAA